MSKARPQSTSRAMRRRHLVLCSIGNKLELVKKKLTYSYMSGDEMVTKLKPTK